MDEFVSKLPTYKVSRSEDFPEFLLVWCEYEDCVSYEQSRPFLVHRVWMRPIRRIARSSGKEFRIMGRSCPYCFRAGRIPPRSQIR